MKCSADVVTACDRSNEGCGFCREHCPYKNCPVHGIHDTTLVYPEYKCQKPSEEICPIEQGAPDCTLDDDGKIVWMCPFYKQDKFAYICEDCGQPTNRVWRDAKSSSDTKVGKCNDCQFKWYAETYPAPPLEDMKLTTHPFEGYREWPHNYIPRNCPYCNTPVKAHGVGSYHDHVCNEHTCEKCKVYFGFTD